MSRQLQSVQRRVRQIAAVPGPGFVVTVGCARLATSKGAGVVTQATVTDWKQGQEALREEVARVTSLLRSIHDSHLPALGVWNIGELAVHLSQAWRGIPAMARRDLSPIYEVLPDIAGTAGDSVMKDIWDLGDLMIRAVKTDPERDLGVLADRIEGEADRYFAECVGADPNEPVPWMVEGFTLPRSIFTYHLLDETVVHAYDIARAAGRKWRIEPSHAAMALGRFVFPVWQAAPPRMFVNGAKAAGLRATYDMRLRGGDRFYFVFNDGDLTIEKPSSRTVDCHISADPVAMLLVAFARRSQWPAIATGKLMAWGRKPWLGFQLRSLLRNP